MFLDMQEVAESIKEADEDLHKLLFGDLNICKVKRNGKYGDIRLLDLDKIAHSIGEIKGTELYGPGNHCEYAVHIYKSPGRTFFFCWLPYFCFLKKLKLYEYIRKLIPGKEFYLKKYAEGKIKHLDELYLFKFNINKKTFYIHDFLLKYPDWLYFKKGLEEVIKMKEDLIKMIKTYDKDGIGFWEIEYGGLENLYNIIRIGSEEENKRRILCMVSGEAPTAKVPDFEKELKSSSFEGILKRYGSALGESP